jgi:hypothetical protein
MRPAAAGHCGYSNNFMHPLLTALRPWSFPAATVPVLLTTAIVHRYVAIKDSVRVLFLRLLEKMIHGALEAV